MGKNKGKQKQRRFRMASRNFAMIFVLALQLVLAAGAFQAFQVFYYYCSSSETMDTVAVYLLYFALTILVWVVSYIFLFKIIYSREDPEFKIPWVVLLLAIPGIGIVVYLLFKQRGLRYKQRKTLEGIKAGYQPYFRKRITKDDSYKTSENQPIAFLENVDDFSAHKNNKLAYYKCGEEFFPDFIEKLKEAKEFIFLEFFIVREGKEWGQIHEILKQKASEGVEVRLLYDDFGCFKYLPASYAMKLRKEGIKAYRFNRVGILLRGSYNNRSHRKIAVIDHKYGFTGGMNLGDEYANDVTEFGYWKDTMVRVEGSCINSMIALFLSNYDLNRREVSDYAKYMDHKYEEYPDDSICHFFGTGPENVTPIREGEQNYVNIIESANKTLYISTPYLVPSIDLMHSLQRAAYRGVDVHLIVPGIPDKKLVYLVAQFNFQPLLEAGVKIYKYNPGFNHMKSCLADDKIAFIGTINMDYRSLVHHFECGMTIIGGDIMNDIKDDFHEMVDQSALVPNNFHLTKREKFKCAILRLFMPLL